MQLGGGGGGGGGGSRKGAGHDKKSMWPEAGSHHHHHHHFRHAITSLLLFFMVVLSCAVLYRSASPFEFFPPASFHPSSVSGAAASTSIDGNLSSNNSVTRDIIELERVLKNASMSTRTVIITTLNEAWAAPNSIFDLFLESFRIGNQTERLLDHLVVIALDEKAYARCSHLHPHCYALSSRGMNFSEEAYFMTPDYLKMMWRRIDFLRIVLDLGYNFVFTDADIMWFRNPFAHFHSDADFQIACDSFKGSNSFDLNNKPNGGFTYVKSNTRTTHFYKFWYTSRETYPGLHDQDVLNKIKHDPYITKIGLSIRFLETSFFGGFCEPSKDFNRVCTMHANCCIGLDNKVHDLRVMLDDWRNFTNSAKRNTSPYSYGSAWSVPQRCGAASFHTPRKIVKRGTKRR